MNIPSFLEASFIDLGAFFYWFSSISIFLYFEDKNKPYVKWIKRALWIGLAIALNFLNSELRIAYIFGTSLIISAIFDLYELMIPRACTIAVIPIWAILAYYHMLPITVTDSLIGILLGFVPLMIINQVFKRVKGRTGIGQGDMELGSMIGGFLGPEGLIYSLNLACVIGIISGIAYSYGSGQDMKSIKLPFGTFLSAGTIVVLTFLQIQS